MIKYNELKTGDLVMVEYDGQLKEGEVRNLNGDEKQVCVETDVQDFWYELSDLHPIALDESQLFKLGFQKQMNEDGSVKYMKGAFRVLLHSPDDFSQFEIWYREDHRRIAQPIQVHTFQNHYLEMTKIHLTKG
ncbi:MAG: hypothetical protein WKF91_08400 [Segetibacter sp.]|jgi:hypothetical protein